MSIFDAVTKADKAGLQATCTIDEAKGIATIVVPLKETPTVSSTGKSMVLGATGSKQTGKSIEGQSVRFNATITVAIPRHDS